MTKYEVIARGIFVKEKGKIRELQLGEVITEPAEHLMSKLREKLPGIDNAAIEAAITHYRSNQSEKNGKIFDECLKVAKQHMIKVK